jgi:ABC-type multidrug transport system fused ATPase/permease subunit
MRQHFGYVSQEPVLFDETISINVRCGKLLATHAEIEAALEKANALEYIRSLPLVPLLLCNQIPFFGFRDWKHVLVSAALNYLVDKR